VADNKIEFYRKKAGLSMCQLAKRAGVHVQSLSTWEKGIRQPRVFFAICLAQALGTTVEELFSP